MNVKQFVLGPLATNCYLLEAGGEKAIIDPGFWSDRLISEIEGLKYILLTHGHVDHIMGVHEIKQRTGAEILAHEAEAGALGDTRKSLYSFMDFYSEPQASEKADRFLSDGQEILLGGQTIKILHTPGHTLGSVCFLTDEFLFSGDTLFFENVGRTDFPGGDFGQIRASIEKLCAIPGDRRVFPGHDRETTLAHERIANPYLGGLE